MGRSSCSHLRRYRSASRTRSRLVRRRRLRRYRRRRSRTRCPCCSHGRRGSSDRRSAPSRGKRPGMASRRCRRRRAPRHCSPGRAYRSWRRRRPRRGWHRRRHPEGGGNCSPERRSPVGRRATTTPRVCFSRSVAVPMTSFDHFRARAGRHRPTTTAACACLTLPMACRACQAAHAARWLPQRGGTGRTSSSVVVRITSD